MFDPSRGERGRAYAPTSRRGHKFVYLLDLVAKGLSCGLMNEPEE
jgi:hypothetical protein